MSRPIAPTRGTLHATNLSTATGAIRPSVAQTQTNLQPRDRSVIGPGNHMTRTEQHMTTARLHAALEQIIADFGLWGVSRAVVARIFTRRRQRLRRVDELSDHLRRDIGLTPYQAAQPRLGQLYF